MIIEIQNSCKFLFLSKTIHETESIHNFIVSSFVKHSPRCYAVRLKQCKIPLFVWEKKNQNLSEINQASAYLIPNACILFDYRKRVVLHVPYLTTRLNKAVPLLR